jgi:Virulence factor BrkB
MPPATVKDEAASSAHDMRNQAQAARATEPIPVSDPPRLTPGGQRTGEIPRMTSMHDADSNTRDDVPDDPTDLSGGSWLAAAKRTLKEYKDDDLQDRAAALTYFGIQSIFPGLLVLVSLLGFVGKSATAADQQSQQSGTAVHRADHH